MPAIGKYLQHSKRHTWWSCHKLILRAVKYHYSDMPGTASEPAHQLLKIDCSLQSVRFKSLPLERPVIHDERDTGVLRFVLIFSTNRLNN